MMTDKKDTSFSLHGQRLDAPAAAPGLHVTATPIGNLADVTLRALETLAGCGLILCEDTRITARLLQRYGIGTRMQSYHEHNAANARPAILARLAKGEAVALVSDAGTPVVSDPGYQLINACLRAGEPVHTAPGVSAVLTALSLSGLPSERFFFAGFAPSKAGQRQKFLADLAGTTTTTIVFESPKRIMALLEDISNVMGNRPIAVCRELTKKFEEVIRGSVQQVLADLGARETVKGEITVLIGAGEKRALEHVSEIDAEITEALKTSPASQAAALLAQQFGLKKKDIYARILELKQAE